MKSVLIFSLSIGLLHGSVFAQDKTRQEREQKAQLVHRYYRQAEIAWEKGDVELAKQSLNSALKLDPSHAQSYALALQIKGSSAKITSDGRKRMFSTTILPVVDFRNLPLNRALDILTKLIEKHGDGKFHPNFILQDPKKQLRDKEITLNLKNVPASVVFEYLLKTAHAGASYEEHATVIRPRN